MIVVRNMSFFCMRKFKQLVMEIINITNLLVKLFEKA